MSTPTASRRPGWLFRSFSILTVTLMLTSCVSGGDSDGSNDDSPEDESEGGGDGAQSGEDDALATSMTTASTSKGDLKVNVLTLERTDNSVVLLEMSATNVDDDDLHTTHIFGKPSRMGGERDRPDGVTLINTVNNKRHYPLTESDNGECLCSDFEGTLKPEDTLDFWVAFPEPPDDVSAMTVTTPVTVDFIDIPLTDAEDPDTDITERPVNDPEILPLTSYQDDLSGESSRENTGDETSIMLSSDVLFDTNKSDLTSDADEALEQVAQEIDDSSDKEVQIDGYTDNTGNDSINNPLSEDRAESVQEKLEELVTRGGISYDSTGHGSSDPVADNGSDEGRKKNRRVTITFEK